MRNLSRTFYISAGFKPETHNELAKELAKLSDSMIDGIGTYNGLPNLVWLVSGDHTMEKEILDLARKFNQESVLVVHGDNQDAELVFIDGARKKLGKIVCLGNEEGQLRGRDYTFVNEKFYVVE